MGILDIYFKTIARQVLSEIEFISSLLEHHGLRGSQNERILADLLTRFLPRRYAIGAGVVIDSAGHQSRQCDVIIYDNWDHPQLLQQRNAVMFPVESVYATVEVKTTLRSGDLEAILQNSLSVKRLSYHEEIIPGPVGNAASARSSRCRVCQA